MSLTIPSRPKMRNGLLLEMKDISKKFGGTCALNQVGLGLFRGEVVGLVGENGAGKSTLMNILSGIHRPSGGSILLQGESIQLDNPADARRYGIEMVHQEPALAPNLSAAENLFLGRELKKGRLFLNSWEMVCQSSRILGELGLSLDPRRKAGELSMAEKEAVSIARAMAQNPKILILDEVTAPLDRVETSKVFDIIVRLRNSGMGIIFIGHRLREIFEICDRIIVLRDGRNVGSVKSKESNREQVIGMMVGQSRLGEEGRTYQPQRKMNGEVLLCCKGISSGSYFRNVTFQVRRGEIIGLAGLKGSGRSEWAKAMFGLIGINKGEVYAGGKAVQIKNPIDAVRAGIGYIPGDRQTEGLCLYKSVGDNLNITVIDLFAHRFGFLHFGKMKENAYEMMKKLQIKARSVKQPVASLSGGNQQKVMIGKWLARELDVFIFDEPTRGVDVGAKAEIHKFLAELKNQGKGIVVISSELPEILRVSDRILTMSQGEIGMEMARGEATEEKILKYLHDETTTLIKGKRILVVDDETDVLETVADLLEPCVVETANIYEKAVELMGKNRYDIVILDIMGVNGFELLKTARVQGFPAVMLTSHSLSLESLRKSMELGAAFYFPKEKLSELKAFIEHLVLQQGRPIWDRLFDEFEEFFSTKFNVKRGSEEDLKRLINQNRKDVDDKWRADSFPA